MILFFSSSRQVEELKESYAEKLENTFEMYRDAIKEHAYQCAMNNLEDNYVPLDEFTSEQEKTEVTFCFSFHNKSMWWRVWRKKNSVCIYTVELWTCAHFHNTEYNGSPLGKIWVKKNMLLCPLFSAYLQGCRLTTAWFLFFSTTVWMTELKLPLVKYLEIMWCELVLDKFN